MNDQKRLLRNSFEAFEYWRPIVIDLRSQGMSWPNVAEHIDQGVKPLREWASRNLEWHERVPRTARAKIMEKAKAAKEAEKAKAKAEREARKERIKERKRIADEKWRAEILQRRDEREAARTAKHNERLLRQMQAKAKSDAKKKVEKPTPDELFAAALAKSGTTERFTDAKVPAERRLNIRPDVTVFMGREANS